MATLPNVKAPTLLAHDVILTTQPPNQYGMIPYNLSAKFDMSDDLGLDELQWQKAGGGPWRTVIEWPVGTLEAKDVGHGYNGALPPGSYVIPYRVYDKQYNYALVKIAFTL